MFYFKVAIVDLSLDGYTKHNGSNTVIICYAVVSCLLVGVHLLALLMSTCVLPELKSFIRRNDLRNNQQHKKSLGSLDIYIEIAWTVSTGVGLFLFLLELGFILWIKMNGYSQSAAIAATITLCLIGIPFILFSVGFYTKVAHAKVHIHRSDLETIERQAINSGWLFSPVNPAKSIQNTVTIA